MGPRGRAGRLAAGALALAAMTGCAGATAESRAAAGPVERSLAIRHFAFEPADVSIPAGRTFVIAFDNADPGVPHGLVLYADRTRTITLATAPIVVGVDHKAFEVAGLIPGRYLFSCVIHPNLEADLVVGP